jgi:LuxR family quorum-sensing system transcriptional regulator CciR
MEFKVSRQTVVLRPRQVECLSWAARGLAYAAIGAQLGISPVTVKEHIEGARDKLDVETRAEAIAKAQALGLI